MLAVVVYMRGEENPDPQASMQEYVVLFFTEGTEMVIKTT